MESLSTRLRSFDMRRHMPKIALCLTLALMCSLLIPSVAYAEWDWTDPGGSITQLIDDLLFGKLYDMVEGLMNNALHVSLLLAPSDILFGDFNQLLSANLTGTTLFDALRLICNSTIVPLGHSILALVMLVQVVKISQRIDSTATLPAVKEILFLGVFFVIFTWLINNSFDLCATVFDEVNVIAESVNGYFGFQGSVDPVTIPRGGFGLDDLIPLLGVAFLMFVGSLAGAAVSYVVGWARALQLYVMATFSPIPLSLLGFEETRSFGINFAKNFIAVCLAGAIMLIVMVAYPILMFGCASSLVENIGSVLSGDLTGFFSYGIKALACTFMYIFALLKSGTWARDILGG